MFLDFWEYNVWSLEHRFSIFLYRSGVGVAKEVTNGVVMNQNNRANPMFVNYCRYNNGNLTPDLNLFLIFLLVFNKIIILRVFFRCNCWINDDYVFVVIGNVSYKFTHLFYHYRRSVGLILRFWSISNLFRHFFNYCVFCTRFFLQNWIR